MNEPRPDPTSITGRADLAAALRSVRESSGVTFRELVERSGGLHGTVSGWFSGHHVPIKASADMFDRALRVLGIDDSDEREEWWKAVGRARVSQSRRSNAGARVPYKGLEAFDAADADLFFGRTDVVAALTRRIDSTAEAGGGVVAVIGASGSGKSSMLRAGLTPELPGLRIRTGAADARTFTEELSSTEAAPVGSVLVFDQLEELWTLAAEAERRAFFDALATYTTGSNVVVVGLRADFYRHAVAEDVLTTALVDNPIVVGRLRPDQLREVIVEPARAAGMSVDDGLLRVLTAEMEPSGTVLAHDHGALPMLSHALLATWQAATRQAGTGQAGTGTSGTGKTLTVDDYYATGGLPGAVQQSAEAVFEALGPAGRAEARRVFVRLVNIDDEVLTRRRVARVELFRNEDPDCTDSDDDVEAVIESFTASRLLTVEEESVSVTHEVLLTAWSRLRGWIDDDRAWHLTHRLLTDAAVAWDAGGRDGAALLPAARVESLQNSLTGNDRAADLNVVERDFLDRSATRVEQGRAQKRRRRRVLEVLTGALAVVTALAVTLAVVAFTARADADSRRVEAEAALAGQLAGSAERLRTLDPGLSVHLALAAYKIDPTTSARSALLDASAIHAPVRLPGVSGEARARVDSSGTLVATASADGNVRLWSVDQPAARQRAGFRPKSVAGMTAIEFAPGAPMIALGSATETSLWSVADPDAPKEISVVGGGSKSLAFSPDGRTLASVSAEGAVSVWDVSDSAAPAPGLQLDTPAPSNAVKFSPDGRFLVTVGVARSMQVWDTASYASAVLGVLPDGSTYDYLSVGFSPDGRSLAAGTTGREVARWTVGDRGTLSGVPALTGFTSYVNDVAFSNDGSEVAAVSSDNSIKIWDAVTGVSRETLPGSTVVTSVVFSPDDSTMITAGGDGITRLWPMPGPVMSGQTDTVFVTPVDGSRSRLLVGVGSKGDGLRLWDITDPDRPVASRRNLTPATGDVLTGAAAISWDGTLVAGGTASGGFQLWDTRDLDNPVPLGEPHAAVNSLTAGLAFSRSGNVLAVSPQNTTDVSLWDVRDPSSPVMLSTFDVGANPTVLAFSPDEKTLAIPTLANVVLLLDVSDPGSPRVMTSLGGFDNDAQAVAYSPDGRLLAAGSADHTVRLWDVTNPADPQHIARIVGPRGAIYSVAFDPSGTWLVAGVDGQSMWIWDLRDQWNPSTFATLTAYGDRTNDAVFGASGDAVFAGGPAKDLRVWHTDPEEVEKRICATGGSTITAEEWAQYLPAVPFREVC
nr:helix-turn-helix domain-containing protein [Rhodococcus sp. (in: high G+C Gram-positive bacteria)]